MTLTGAWVALLGAALVATVIALSYTVKNRERRGALPLSLLFVGIIIWILSDLVQMQTGSDPGAWGGLAIRQLGVEVVVVAVLLLGLAYAGRDDLIRWELLAILSIKPLLTVGTALFRTDMLVDTTANDPLPWGYELVATPLMMGSVGYSLALVAIGLGLLAVMMWRAEYAYRWMIFALMLALTVPLAANASFYVGLFPFDPTAGSFLFTSLVVLYAINRWQLMDTTPVARRTVIEQMDDYVFVLDEEGYVTTVNTAADETFSELETLQGVHIGEMLGDESLGDPSVGDQKVERAVAVNGDTRHLAIDKSTLTDYKGDLLAQLVFCRDITEDHRRKEELELLKDVRSRFLRHNLRNELNVILAHARLMLDEGGTPREESYNVIVETGDRLADWAEKARDIERLIEADESHPHDVCNIMGNVVEEVDERHPEVRFENNCEESSEALTVPQVEGAFKDLLDNAARYNDAENPWVRVETRTEGDSVTIYVEDNGPGIDQSELDAIESGEETQLEHSSGFGLWFAHWVVTTSGGEISFDTSNGTTITIELERAPVEPESGEETGTGGEFVAADGAGNAGESDEPE